MHDRELSEFIRTARLAGMSDAAIVEELLHGGQGQSPASNAASSQTKSLSPPQPSAAPAATTRQSTAKSTGAGDTLITIRNLVKTYVVSSTVSVPALKDVSVDIRKGEFLAITGQSGSGKSTFLNLLALIDEPTSGSIEVDGQSIIGLPEEEQVAYRLNTVSMVFQFFNLIESYTALENIVFQLLLQGQSQRLARKRAAEMLSFLGLADKHDAYPKDLSGGQQQRVAVGRALAKDSQFILADEPTAHLDATNGQALIELLRNVREEFKRTVVLVSHEPDQAAQADRVVVLKDGTLDTLSSD